MPDQPSPKPSVPGEPALAPTMASEPQFAPGRSLPDPTGETILPASPPAEAASAPTLSLPGTFAPPRFIGGRTRMVSRDDYERGAEIARGGMGKIVSARDRRHDRPVAIKELLTSSPGSVARFCREALITARLQHPAIVPIYEAGSWEDGEPFFAMKRVDGRSFDEIIATRETLAERITLLPTMIAVAEAIAYAHARGVIHRDLKPHNVLVGSYGETVVIDWGLAKQMGVEEEDPTSGAYHPLSGAGIELTLVGHAVGTPAYMPPEQARGEPVDRRADVYALGAMLYHLLAGIGPYGRASSPRQLLERVVVGPPPPVEDLVPDAPADLLAIVRKAMARDPDQRYPSAGELAADLNRFSAGKLVIAHRYTPRALLARWARRNRIVLAAAALLVAAAVIGVIVYVVRIDSERARTDAARKVAESERLRAEELFARAQAQTVVLFEEQGASRLAAGQPLQAAAYLSRSYGDGNRSPSLRYLLAVAMRSAESIPLVGHHAQVTASEYTRDGKRLVTASLDGSIRVWDLATGRALVSHDGPAAEISIAVAPAGDQVAIGRSDGTAEIRALDTLEVATAIEAHTAQIRRLAISPDGAQVAMASDDGELRVFETGSGARLWQQHAHVSYIHSLAYSADGRRLLSSGGGETHLWAPADGKRLTTLAGEHAAFDPAGRRVATAGRASGDGVTMWDAASGRALDTVPSSLVPHGVTLVFSPDGARLAICRWMGAAEIWDIGSAKRLANLEGAGAGMSDADFSPDGRWLATASWDRTAQIWDTDDGRAVATLAGQGVPLFTVAFSPDGKLVLTYGGDDTPRLWNVDALGIQPTIAHPQPLAGVAHDPTGKRIATVDNTGLVRIFDATTAALERELEPRLGGDRSISFSPLDGTLVGGGADGVLIRWDLATGQVTTRFEGHSGGIASIRFDPTGAQMVTAGDDLTIRVWEAASGKLIRTIDAGDLPLSADFTPDLKAIVSTSNRFVHLWDASTGTHLTSMRGRTHTVAISRDAARMVTSGNDETVIWDVANRARVISLEGHAGSVNDAVFTPDDAFVLTGGEDGTVRVWEASSGRLLDVLEGHRAAVQAIAISPDGRRAVSASRDHTVRLWDLHLEERSPAAIKELIDRGVPWALDDSGRTVARSLEPTVPF